MSVKRTVTNALAALMAAGIGYIGVGYLLFPDGMAPGFGLPGWPHGDASGFLSVKGIRDLSCGIAVLALLATGQRRALGWLLMADALIPLGDAIIVLSHDGSTATALGVHGASAALVAITATLLLTERHAAQPEPRTQHTSPALRA